jgi:hypothetical protein
MSRSFGGRSTWLLALAAATCVTPAALAGTLLTLQFTDPRSNSNFDDHAEHENTPFVSGNKTLTAWLFHEKKGVCSGDPRCKPVSIASFPDVAFVIRKWGASREIVAAELVAARDPVTHAYSAHWNTTGGGYPDGIYVLDFKVQIRDSRFAVHKIPLAVIVDNVPGAATHAKIPVCDTKWSTNYSFRAVYTKPIDAPDPADAFWRSHAGGCEWVDYSGPPSLKSTPLVARLAQPFAARPPTGALWVQGITAQKAGQLWRFVDLPSRTGSPADGPHVAVSFDVERYAARDGERNVGTVVRMIGGFVDPTTTNGTRDWLYGVELSSTRYTNAADYIACGSARCSGRVVRVSPTGEIQTVIGMRLKPDVNFPYWDSRNTSLFPEGSVAHDDHYELVGAGVPGERAGLLEPNDVIQDPRAAWSRYVYVSDTLNHRVVRVDLRAGSYETYAGSAAGQSGYVNGIGTAARFNEPWGLAMKPDGTLYVSDRMNHAIRIVNPGTRAVSTLFRSPLRPASSVTVDQSKRVPKIGGKYALAPDDPGMGTYRIDGTFSGGTATLIWPGAMRLDSQGNLVVYENVVNSLRRVSPSRARIDLLTYAPGEIVKYTTPYYGTLRIDTAGDCGPVDDIFFGSVAQRGNWRVFPSATGWTSVDLLGSWLRNRWRPSTATGTAEHREEWRGLFGLCGGGAIWTGDAWSGLRRATLKLPGADRVLSADELEYYRNGERIYWTGTVDNFPLRNSFKLVHPVNDQFGGDAFDNLVNVSNAALAARIVSDGWGSTTGTRPEITGKDLRDLLYYVRWNCGRCVDADYELTPLASPASDAAAPVVTAGPTVSALARTTATIRWTTSEPTVGFVEYSEQPVYDPASPNRSMYGNASAVRPSSTAHSVTLKGLRPGTRYQYRVRIKDAFGNQNAGLASPAFTTAP